MLLGGSSLHGTRLGDPTDSVPHVTRTISDMSLAPFPPLSTQAPPPLHLLSWQLPLLESLTATLSANVMALLVGPSGSGKTRMARLLARLAGRTLLEVPLTAGTDTSDLLGSFEQLEPSRRVAEVGGCVSHTVSVVSCSAGSPVTSGFLWPACWIVGASRLVIRGKWSYGRDSWVVF